MKSNNDIIALAGYWEPDSFMIRSGRAAKDIENNSSFYSDAMTEKLYDIGISMVVWHYYKGLGIKTEENEMRKTTEFFRLLDAYGIKKGVYINFGSVFSDTFLNENPHAENWLSCDQSGMPHQYSEFYRIYYRLRPCMSNIEFAEYAASAAIKAIKEAGADHIQFDNSAQMPCYCPKCRKGFIEYLLNKFPISPLKGQISFKERFGYDFTGRFELPRGTVRMPIDNLPSAHEPGLYEWIRYRQHVYETAHRKASEMIREEAENVTIGWNVALDYGEFTGLVWGIDPETSYRCRSDYFFSEDENHAGIENGKLISHIRTYKYANVMNNRLLIHNLPGGTDERKLLNYAEAAVYNSGCLGRVMWATDNKEEYAMLKKVLKMFKSNKEVYIETKLVAKVALYRCSESETANWADTTIARYALEQLLIINNIQYDYIMNDTFEKLSNYEVLICTNTISVSDQNVNNIASFIKNGGKLICTENSFYLNEFGRKRKQISDAGLSGERDDSIGHTKNIANESIILNYLQLNNSYKNNIAHIPKIEYSESFHWDIQSAKFPVIGKQYYAEPVNKNEIMEVLNDLLPENEIITNLPKNVVVGFFKTYDGNRVIHILDYEVERSLNDSVIKLKKNIGITKATFKTIDEEHDIPIKNCNEFIEFCLPPFKTYGFIKIYN